MGARTRLDADGRLAAAFERNQRVIQAFAFDPDNVDPDTCSISAGVFPDDDGEGLPGSPEVEMRIEWWSGSSWVLVHTELEGEDPYCSFSSCSSHDLSSGEWPDGGIPISIGLHRLKAKVVQDDEGVPSTGWAIVEFYIDPAPTPTPSKTPTPSNTPTASLTPTPSLTPSATPVATCPDLTLSWKNDGGSHVEWYMTNSGSTMVTLTRVELSWPDTSDLEKIELDGSDIWNGNASSPADISGPFTGVSRDLSSGETKVLRFNLSSSLQAGDYTATVHSSEGCSDSHTQPVTP